MAGHADGGDILFAQGVDRDGGHQGRIDTSTQAHQHLGESAFANVVACAQNQCLIDRCILARIDRAAIARERRAVEVDQVLGKRMRLGDNFAVGAQGKAGSVEDQAVIASHLVDHNNRSIVPLRDSGQHPVA